jgi:hypothetical protein
MNESFKFVLSTGLGSQRGGLEFFMKDMSGNNCGLLASSFSPAPRGRFSSYAERPGYLRGKASVWLPEGNSVVVQEMPMQEHYYRKDADKAFREWVRDNEIKDKMVDGFVRLRLESIAKVYGSAPE